MNVAFSALLTFVLVLPGITLRYVYACGLWRWNHPIAASMVPYLGFFGWYLYFKRNVVAYYRALRREDA
ncbi:MAG TPA: hypothetical protein VF158_08750 [Longimicrobiales bacterium]